MMYSWLVEPSSIAAAIRRGRANIRLEWSLQPVARVTVRVLMPTLGSNSKAKLMASAPLFPVIDRLKESSPQASTLTQEYIFVITMPEILHYWVDFNFNRIEKITHNENGFSAAYNGSYTIVVWKNQEIGPNIREGEVVCIIIDQFDRIDQMQWIANSNDLLIRSGDRIFVWDIFTNSIQHTYFTTEPVLFAKMISIGLLIMKIGGKFSLFTSNDEITSHLTSDIIIDIDDGIYVYPSLFKVLDGEWTEEETYMSWGERGLRRKLEGENEIQINGDLIHLDEDDIDDLTLPAGYRHQFNDCGVVIIRCFENFHLIRTKQGGAFLLRNAEEAIVFEGNKQVIPSHVDNYFVLRDSEDEERIVLKHDKIVREELHTDLENLDLILENVHPSMYLDIDQDLRFVRYNARHAFLWYPDHLNDFVFVDMFTHQGSIFTDLGRERHSYIQVTNDATQLAKWNRGDHYPSGKLSLYNILNPSEEPIVLYDEQIVSKRIDEDEFTGDTDISFPIILPSWHRIELWAYSEQRLFKSELSYSQYFMILEKWSKSENAAILEYPSAIPDEDAFVFFGTLDLPIGDEHIVFEEIAPEWTFHQETGLIAYYSRDQHCYVIDTFDPYLLPVYSFEARLPYAIKFSPRGDYLVYLAFHLRETTIKTHPNDGFQEELSTDFPYLEVMIHNLSSQDAFRRSVRFPILLDLDEIQIEAKETRIYIFYPSYTDNVEESVLMFDLIEEKFHQINGAEQYRLWMTYSRNSPYSRIQKGEEFPVEQHPEISRDYAMRPFNVFEGVLVRKEDDAPISMADINLEEQPQISSAEIYNLENTTEMKLPFYYEERMKPIYLDKELISSKTIHKMKALNRTEELPGNLFVDIEKIPRDNSIRKRIAERIVKDLSTDVVHNNNGIAYLHPDAEQYQAKMEMLLDELNLRRFIAVDNND